MKKVLLIFLCMSNLVLMMGCWNYKEINDYSHVMGSAIDYDEKNKKVMNTTQIAYPSIEKGKTKIDSAIIKSEGDSMYDAVRNLIQNTGKKLFFAHKKVLILGSGVIKNEKVLIGLLDFIKRDREHRDDFWIALSKEKTAGEILNTQYEIDEILSFTLDEAFDNVQYIEKYDDVPLWKFVDRLTTEGVSPVLPTISIVHKNGKKVPIIKGVAVFKGTKVVGWLNEEETRAYRMIMDKVKNGVITFKQPSTKKDEKVALEINDSETKIIPFYDKNQIGIHIDINMLLSIDELNTETDYISKEGRKKIIQNAENAIKNQITHTIHKVQKEYDSDIFEFAMVIHQRYPKEWEKIKDHWDQVFKNIKVVVTPHVEIKGSALRSKPIKVGD